MFIQCHFSICAWSQTFFVCLRETIKENKEGKRKKIIKLMKKHKNKVKRNNAIIMKKTEK